VLALEPSNADAQAAVRRLPNEIKQQEEQQKTEALGSLPFFFFYFTRLDCFDTSAVTTGIVQGRELTSASKAEGTWKQFSGAVRHVVG
jgi:hypothetical protein